jgi:death-on-curing protein
MTQYVVVSAKEVITIHEKIIGVNELQGLAKDKSLDAVLDRVHNRLQYGFIGDVFDLAACYGTFIAKVHCFNDANKRTAATVLFFILKVNGIKTQFTGISLGEWIVEVATNKKNENELAAWLRTTQS